MIRIEEHESEKGERPYTTDYVVTPAIKAARRSRLSSPWCSLLDLDFH